MAGEWQEISIGDFAPFAYGRGLPERQRDPFGDVPVSGSNGIVGYHWLDQDWMTQEIISLNSNSAQPGINQQGVRALPFLMPPDAMVEAFDHIAKKLTDRLFAACQDSRPLAALRDALLPRLIRGEIRVKDAERFLKERGL